MLIHINRVNTIVLLNVDAVEEWGIADGMKGLSFDTTASNAEIKNGTRTLIEQKLNWIYGILHVVITSTSSF